jgi:hypothetical protein
MEKPLFDEEHDNKEIENIDALLHIERHKWDISCFYFDGDPIYDTDDDGSKDKIADFWSCGQPNTIKECETYFMMHEQPCHPTNKVDLQVHKGGFHGQMTSEIFQPWMSPTHDFLMHENPSDNDVFEAAIFCRQQHVQSWVYCRIFSLIYKGSQP